MSAKCKFELCAIIFVTCGVLRVEAVTLNWRPATTGEWAAAANWIEGTAPTNGGEDVYITNAGSRVLLDGATPLLNSLRIGGPGPYTNALVFTNWTACLVANAVTVGAYGALMSAGPILDDGVTNRVWIAATNFTLEPDGWIYAKGCGYTNRTGPGAYTNLPGIGAGAGHGGRGANACKGVLQLGGDTYGVADIPETPGSGGGGIQGGNGGGVIRIDAAIATIDGTITADGNNFKGNDYGGGGSGGSILLNVGTFGGSSTGLLTASGGNGRFGALGLSGGGGGGRIAVNYSSVAPNAGVRLAAGAGTGYSPYSAEVGTIFLPDTVCLSEPMPQILKGRLVFPDTASWTVTNLVLTNGEVAFGDGSPFALNIVSNLTIGDGPGSTAVLYAGQFGAGTGMVTVSVGGDLTLNGGRLGLGGPAWTYMTSGFTNQVAFSSMSVGGTVTLTNGGGIWVYSGVTNAVEDYGALVTVTGDMILAPGSWVYPYSNPTNGGSALFRVRDLLIMTNAGFDADSTGNTTTNLFVRKGYQYETGPGRGYGGSYGPGAGFGGQGGACSGPVAGGPTNGSMIAPCGPGSGGGKIVIAPFQTGGSGGGAVRIEAGEVTMNGTITANGSLPIQAIYGGGGSGGSIFIMCDLFGGDSNGLLRADGGNGFAGISGDGGGGGGGRIAVWQGVPVGERQRVKDGDLWNIVLTNSWKNFYGTISAAGGAAGGARLGATSGEPGTVAFIVFYRAGTVMNIR